MIVALAGGVGGAKLCFGLSRAVANGELDIIVNTADDFVHLGQHVSPDIDTVVYTLAGIANPETGWGQAGETWQFMDMIERLGGPTWFRLGDRDLATNVWRTVRLNAGEMLSSITADFCARLGVKARVHPMTDDPVMTEVQVSGGTLSFQDYFVRQRGKPLVTGFKFSGIDTARVTAGALAALTSEDLQFIVLCPSNPFVSIDPILAVGETNQAINASSAFKIAVSPIVAGQALKGPAAAMMANLGHQVSPFGIAKYFHGLIDGIVIDELDARYVEPIRAMGIKCATKQTIMRTDDDRIRLANEVLELGGQWASGY